MQTQPSQKPLPKLIAQMVEKNNLVLAIKTLAEQDGISMAEAKERIDTYEAKLKAEQAQKQQRIRSSQTAKGNDQASNGMAKLQQGLDSYLTNKSYKPPLIPYWGKRLLLAGWVIGMIGILGWTIWQLF